MSKVAVPTMIVEAYRELKNGPQVGLRFGISTSTVYRILREVGEPRVGAPPPPSFTGRRKFTPEQEQDISNRYKTGTRTTSLRNEFNCSAWLIRDIAKRYGARIFGKGNRNREFTVEEVKKMKDLFLSGASQFEIGKHLGVHQVIISRVLKANGIESIKRLPAKGENHGSWKGGRVKLDGGYVGITYPFDGPFASMRNRMGYISEHRLVMAQKLRRPLVKGENVHHLNGIRDDNREENLELWVVQQPQGQRAKDRHCLTCTCPKAED